MVDCLEKSNRVRIDKLPLNFATQRLLVILASVVLWSVEDKSQILVN